MWNHDEGWGVIDSPDTPGGCWIHITTPSVERRAFGLEVGRHVTFMWRKMELERSQDGFSYVATDAWYVGEKPFRRRTSSYGSQGGLRTSLTITFDDETSGGAEAERDEPTPCV